MALKPTGTIYEGRRDDSGCVVLCNGEPIDLRLDLWNHSPTGFEWGYGGSGPAQTALAILADFLGDDEFAIAAYQLFKWKHIAPQRKAAFALTGREILDWFSWWIETAVGKLHSERIAELRTEIEKNAQRTT